MSRTPKLAAVLLLGLLVACNGGVRYEYPDSVVRSWEEHCASTEDPDGCMCGLEQMQDNIPYEDIRAFEDGEPPYRPYSKGVEASRQWKAMNRRIFEVTSECSDVWVPSSS